MAHRFSLAIALVVLAAAALAPTASAGDFDRLIAPTDVCADQTNPLAPAAVQEQAMRCMTDFARGQSGLGTLGDLTDLDRSARAKSDDILRCDSFSHEACGRTFTYWMQRVGYIPARCWRAGENIAWGTGSLGSVRSIFRTWIHSPEHRENILGPTARSASASKSAGSWAATTSTSGPSTSALTAATRSAPPCRAWRGWRSPIAPTEPLRRRIEACSTPSMKWPGISTRRRT